MAGYWLVDKLFTTQDQTDPIYPFLGSANWMKALAMKSSYLIEEPKLAKNFYVRNIKSKCSSNVGVQAVDDHYKSLHYLAAVKSIASLKEETYDLIRPAIISWYYALYFASKAFLWAKCSNAGETHTGTAKQLQHHVIFNNLFIEPFSMYLPTIVEKEFEKHISENYRCDRFELINEPRTNDDAQSALVAYLRGTAKYEQEKTTNSVRKKPEFKNLKVDNFRTKKARELRDRWFRKKYVNILVQAFRYRGKANYRDGLYLSYGDDQIEKIFRLTEDMHSVAKAFMVMVTKYLICRVPSKLWNEYCADIKANTRFNLDKKLLIE